MPRKGIFRIGALTFVLAAAAATGADDHKMRPGEYEMTTQTTIEGTDRTLPPKTLRHCITEEDVKDSKRMALQGNENCEMADIKKSGDRMSWSVVCKQFNSKGNAEMVFHADGYDMTMNMESKGGDRGPMKLHFHTTAHRVGNCKP